MDNDTNLSFQEFVVSTRSTTLRGWHNEAWKAVHGKKNVEDGRDFQFHFDQDVGKLLIRMKKGTDKKHSICYVLPKGECRFMVRVHAVKRLCGKRERPVSAEEMPAWIAQRMNGFAIRQEITVSPLEWYPMDWGKGALATTLVTGQAVVTDADQALATMSGGIGRARGFGLGMVILLPLAPSDQITGSSQAA
ncbi:type I-E CRISPR-associated protein Cas6/Cse3/CasE [Acidithiobacillus ferrooxidans]|uniref:type I-E CRISPR-associated protein Cas6/Cse3/CasE n=1 Tax=Acidithiobacillus ferrooxidans TaxID=920 RepID=UPI000AD5CA67|nr:type I-E CRISPR-associated protein Cas6/Cse3/CasE [Acidithiobacillus ferrooxidans]